MSQKVRIQDINPQEVIDRFGKDPISFFFIWAFLTVISVDYAVTDKLDHSLGNWFYLFPLSGVIMSIITLLPRFRHSKYMKTTGWPYLLFFNIIINLVFVFVLPVVTVYSFFLALCIYVTTYWKGAAGYIVALSMQAVSLLLSVTTSDLPLNDSSSYYFGSITLVTSMAFGGIVLRLTSIDRIVRDEFVKSTRKINLERERLKSLINSVAEAVIATDKKGMIMLYNGAAHDIVNTTHTIKHRHINDVLDLKDSSGADADIVSMVKSSSGVIKRDDLHLETEEDREIAIRITGSPINAASVSRSDQGYIFLFADITKEKSLDEQRDEFVHLLSHELRTPIAIIEGGISIAREDKNNPLSAQQKTWLKRAHESTVYLSSILNDLSSLTKVERDNLKTVPMVTRPYNLLSKLVDDYSEQAEKREITLEIDSKTSKDRLISSELHIHEILQNFVSNAIKYTRENTTITLLAKKAGNGVVFSVQDRGAGISAENQKQLFTKYFRSNDVSTKKAKGTGLGLYHSLNLAKRIGGKIWVESQLGSGTTFFLEVPNMVEKDKKASKAKAKKHK